LIPVLAGILLVTFVMTRLIPGDRACDAGERATPPSPGLSRALRLNDSLPVQFVRYLVNIGRGDFGDSIQYSRRWWIFSPRFADDGRADHWRDTVCQPDGVFLGTIRRFATTA